MMIEKVRFFFFSTLRGRLILSVALIHALMMSLFVADSTFRQRAMLLENQTEEAVAMSQSLATSSAIWIAADDISGLQEIAEAQRRYPEIIFVILADESGHILAHTDKSKVGLYLLDLPQTPQQTILERSAALVDVASPVMLDEKQVGWARVGLGQKTAAKELANITLAGFLYALAAIAIGSVIAWRMGEVITRRLYVVQDTIGEIKKGNQTARANITGTDEAACIALEFNSMLDMLAQRETRLKISERRYHSLIQKMQVAIVLHDEKGGILASNPLARSLLGLTKDEILEKTLTNHQWNFLSEDGSTLPVSEYPVSRVIASRQPLRDYVVGIVKPNTEIIWELVNAEPELNEDGTLEQIIVSFVDITERKRMENTLRERERHSQSLLRLSKNLESAYSYGEALNAARAEVKEVIGYQNLWVYLLSEDKKYFKSLIAGGDLSETVMAADGAAILPIAGDPMLEEITSAKDIILVEDARTDPRTNKEIVEKLGNRTLINLPIILFDRHLGSVGMGTFGNEGVRIPTIAEQEYLKSMASHLAVALDRIHLLDKRKQSEEALRKSEAELKEAQRVGNLGSWDWDVATDAITWSEEYYRIYGFDPTQPPPGYAEHLKAYTPESAARLDAAVKQSMENGMPYEVDLELARLDAPSRWITARCEIKRDENGRIVGLRGTAQDITERKRAEEAIKKSNALLERIFSSTEFLIAYLDADFNFIRVNRAYAEADGRPEEFFIGKNHFELYPHEENEAIFRRVVQTGEPYMAYAKPFEYPTSPERGTTYWNWTLQPIKEDGRVSALVFSLIDVTERERAIIAQRASDALYRTLVEQADIGIFVADAQGNYIDANPSGCAMLGYTREEILKLNMRNLVSSESQARMPIRFKELNEGRSVTSERMMITKSGALLPVEINGKALDNGNLLGIVHDITERKRNETEREAIIIVSAALRKAVTRNEILTIILEQFINLFESDGAVLAVPNAEGGEDIIPEIGRGIGERFIGLHIPPGKGISRWVIENRKSYLNNQMHIDPLFYPPELLGDSHCVAVAPLIARERSIGAVWIARKKEFTQNDVNLINAIADIAANAIYRVMLYEQTERNLRHLTALHQIDLAITTTFDLNVTLNIILHNVKDELDADAAAILLLDSVSHLLIYADGIGFKKGSIKETQLSLEDPHAGRAASEQKIVSCPDLQREVFRRSTLIEDEGFTTYHAAPLTVKGQVKGVLEVYHRAPFISDAEWLGYFDTLATQAAIAVENDNLFNTLQRSNMELMLAYNATIEGWSRALDLRDKETEGHTQRVTQMALKLAQKMGISHSEQIHIHRGALLHDIGKMGVPDSILNKPGKLTEEEWVTMRHHPAYAYEMLSNITYLKSALDIPYCHHEKWDGSGYPRGLKGNEIPLAARLFAVVDVFDALTSNRPYRKAISREEAYRYIQEQAGSHFDPQIVKTFLSTK